MGKPYIIKKINKSIEVIFISGTPEIHEIVKDVNYNVCKVFSKPLELEQLIQCIDGALGGSSTICKPSARVKPNQISKFIENITQIPPGIYIRI